MLSQFNYEISNSNTGYAEYALSQDNNACNLLHVHKHVWTHLVCTNATRVSNFAKIEPYTNLNTRASEPYDF